MSTVNDGRGSSEALGGGGLGKVGMEQDRAGRFGSGGMQQLRKRKRGLEGGGIPRSMAGYLRRPGGCNLAFEAAHEGEEEGRQMREERSAKVRVDRAALLSMEEKLAAAIEAGSRGGEEEQGGAERPEAQTRITLVTPEARLMSRKTSVATLSRQVEADKRRKCEEVA